MATEVPRPRTRSSERRLRLTAVFVGRRILAALGWEGLIVATTGLVVLLWLHGGILFFWDQALPLSPGRDLYYSYFTWHQLDNFGYPQIPLANLPYFGFFALTVGYLHFDMTVAESLLIYLLFTSSGFFMTKLVKELLGSEASNYSSVAALSAGLVYMFNFYCAEFLLSELWPSWLTYSLAPLLVLLAVRGMKAARLSRPVLGHVVGISLVFQLMSPGFLEAPYFGWTLFLLVIFSVDWFKGSRRINPPRSNREVVRFTVLSVVGVVVTGLWWEYGLVANAYSQVTTGVPGGSNAHVYSTVVQQFTSSSTSPFLNLLNLLALYPVSNPSVGANFYTWQSLYVADSAPFVLLGAAFAIVLFLPLILRRSVNQRIVSNPILYGAILVLVWIGLAGANPVNVAVISPLASSGVPFLNLLYAFRFQFLGFPLAFLFSIAIAKAMLCLLPCQSIGLGQSAEANDVQSEARSQPRSSIRGRWRRPCRVPKARVAVVVVTVFLLVGVYPWYMWTPSATQDLEPASGSPVIPSVVTFPGYFQQLASFLGENSDYGQTLILPEGYSMYGMLYDNASFADDAETSLISGSPMVFHDNSLNGNYQDLEGLIYSPLLTGFDFANYLNALNIKFVLLNTVFYGGLDYPYYNISYLESFLSHQLGMVKVEQFGPIPLYLNELYDGVIQTANSVGTFHGVAYPTNASPLLDGAYVSPSLDLAVGEPSVSTLSYSSSGLTLTYESYTSGVNPVAYYTNSVPLNVSVDQYPYLTLNFSSDSSAFFSLYANFSSVSNGSKTYMDGLLPAVSPSPSISESGSGYYSSGTFNPLVYLLRPSFVGEPQIAPTSSSYTLERLYLGVYFENPSQGASTSVRISSMILTDRPPVFSASYFVASFTNSSTQTLWACGQLTNVSNPGGLLVSSQEVDPTDYRASISNQKGGAFILILKQSFDSSWIATVNGVPLPSSSHCLANGYANGWLLSTQGNYSVDIFYAPQLVYDGLALTSVVSNFILVGLSLFVWLRSRLRSHQ